MFRAKVKRPTVSGRNKRRPTYHGTILIFNAEIKRGQNVMILSIPELKELNKEIRSWKRAAGLWEKETDTIKKRLRKLAFPY